MGRPGKHARPRQEVQIDILNRLTIKPSLKGAAREVGINPATIFKWIRESVDDPSIMLDWLGHKDTFANLINLARKLQIVVLEHEARSLATLGHSQPRFHDGAPVYRHDAKIEADALSMSDEDWNFFYAENGRARPRTDVFARDENGALIPEEIVSPPNAQLLVKMLASLVPGYAEKSELSVTHQGRVLIEGDAQQPQAALPPPASFNESFGLTSRPDQQQHQTNVLAVPRVCADSAEFDARFRNKKLLREVVVFRDSDGKLLPPLPDDVIVAGSIQARAFEDAGIIVEVVHPTTLIDEGFENDWLKALAPGHKPKFVPPTPEENLEVAVKAAAKMAEMEAAEKPGKASARFDSENLGYGRPAPGGRRVEL
jgi:hypothetical protein